MVASFGYGGGNPASFGYATGEVVVAVQYVGGSIASFGYGGGNIASFGYGSVGAVVPLSAGWLIRAADFDWFSGTPILEHADDPVLRAGTGSLTLMLDLWRAGVTAGTNWAMAKWDFAADQREYGLELDNATGLLSLRVTPDGVAVTSRAATSYGVIPAGQWVHAVAWYDVAGTLNIQLDNGVVDSVAYSGGIFNGSSSFHVSGIRSVTLWDPWHGRLRRAARWNRVLSAAERTTLWQDGLTMAYGELSPALKVGLLNFWNLAEESDGSAAVVRVDSHGSNDLSDPLLVPSVDETDAGVDVRGSMTLTEALAA